MFSCFSVFIWVGEQRKSCLFFCFFPPFEMWPGAFIYSLERTIQLEVYFTWSPKSRFEIVEVRYSELSRVSQRLECNQHTWLSHCRLGLDLLQQFGPVLDLTSIWALIFGLCYFWLPHYAILVFNCLNKWLITLFGLIAHVSMNDQADTS